MERPTGFEPATSSLGSWHSATELRPPERLDCTCGPPHTPAHVRRGGPEPVAYFSDIVYAWITSSLRAFQFTRLLTP